MNTRRTPQRSYAKFDPTFKWTKEDDDSETLVLSLPGFKKEQLKVQMDNYGNLTVSGEGLLTNDQWSMFRKDFRVPKNTSMADIRAKIEAGNLYIRFPKLSAKSQKTEQIMKANDQSQKLNEPDRPTNKTTSEKKQEGDEDNMKKSYANNNNKKASEDIGALNNAGKVQEEKKPSGGKDREAGNGESKISGKENMRKRKAENGSGIGTKLMKKPRHLMVNVGVAFAILVGLTFYVSYKLMKSTEKYNN